MIKSFLKCFSLLFLLLVLVARADAKFIAAPETDPHPFEQSYLKIQPQAAKRYVPRHPLLPEDHILAETTFLGGTPVVTSPYVGIRSTFGGNELIVNISKVNQDVSFLKQRQILQDALDAKRIPYPKHPIVDLSGKIAAIAFLQDRFVGGTANDIDLSNAEIEALINVNRWVLGYMEFVYDNTPPVIGGQRTSNSRVFLDTGFVTLGSLNDCPIYLTMGQIVVPFGRHSTYNISASVTILFAQTKARALLLGYYPQSHEGFYGSVYGFEGDARANGGNNGGINVGYVYHNDMFSGDVGGGYLVNIQDANGMQMTGGTGFAGFGVAAGGETTVRHVPAYNFHANVDVGDFSFLVEYFNVTRRFHPTDLTQNGIGAKPKAYDIEGAYHFAIRGYPTNVAIGYGHTSDGYGLNLPEDRFLIGMNIAIWRDTIQSIEFRHDSNYSTGTTASGRVAAGALPAAVTTPGLGGESNTVTAQFTAYF